MAYYSSLFAFYLLLSGYTFVRAFNDFYIQVLSHKRVIKSIEVNADSLALCGGMCYQDISRCIGFIQNKASGTCELVDDVDHVRIQPRRTWILGK